MTIKYRPNITVGLIALACLTGCGRSDAPVVLEPVSGVESADPGDPGRGEDASAKEPVRTAGQDPQDAVKQTETVTVHVCGAVVNPGVYELPANARVADAILTAGDFEPDADCEYRNLAAVLSDGEQIYVPTEEETAEGTIPVAGQTAEQGSPLTSGVSSGGKININTATEAELMTLPGIGEVKARAVITYRENNGPFQSIEEIRKVEGIKEGSYNKIRDAICVK